jgi:hypothetical protein
MAINVNTVYQTVLLILNKEQRGYMTPTEFNSIGTQVQLEIFEKYFEDLNQQIRVPQTDTDYASRVANLDEKIAEFKTFGTASYITNGLLNYFTLPNVDSYNNNVELYRLGNVLYNNETEVQRVDRSEFYHIDRSKLTKPSTSFPVYLYENNFLYLKPTTIVSDINVDFVKKPSNVIWGFTVGSLGQYVNNTQVYNLSTQPTGSLDFELHISEQTEVILKILLYAGIVIRDPQIIQVAAQQVQAEEINKKS